MDLDNAVWKAGNLVSLNNTSLLIGYGKLQATGFAGVDLKRAAFYYPDFFLKDEAPWHQYTSTEKILISDFEESLQVNNEPTPEWTVGYRTLFEETFEQLQSFFQTGLLKKAVPYVFASTSTKMSLDRFKKALKTALSFVKTYPFHLYAFWDEEGGVLGMTPEPLFFHALKNASELSTVALAGTVKRGMEVEFENNEKESSEHQLVIEGICKTLEQFGTISIGAREVLQLPTLSHLMTPIKLKLNHPFHFEEMVKALHPTPALGAFPKKEGWEWLYHYQSRLDRKFFGAPVGFLDPEEGISACFVSIRHVQWNKEGMRIGAGCGIVKNSNCAQEWAEINLKLQAIRNCLAL
ncbi:MAG: chorismate-binding protein [Candidatus Protochlamydia sp.]|nr:chorismate-binding protein [Candidatus Protochlamydia sp.]